MKSTPRAEYETMLEDFLQACQELKELDRTVDETVRKSFLTLNGQHYETPEKAGKAAAAIVPEITESKAALEEIRVVLDGILRTKHQQEPDQTAAKASDEQHPEAGPDRVATQKLSFSPGMAGETVSDGSWQNAENLVRAGHIDQGLAEMTQLAAFEPNGRARFQRKLLLAEICLSTKREKLAKAILEELAEQIDKFQLEAWESPALVGAAWSRLYRCYKDEEAGTADAERAAKLFDRLCRLDPWQALACSEGRYSSLG